MKNTHLLLVAFVSLFAFTGCEKIDDLNPQGITDSESTPDCNCGEVLEWRLNDNGVTIHTTAKNYCTGHVKVFASCPDDLNPEIHEVGSEFCWSDIW